MVLARAENAIPAIGAGFGAAGAGRRSGRLQHANVGRRPDPGEGQVEFDRMLSLLRAFEHEQVDYVLVGAAALNIHGIIRATEDVDVFIRPERENVDRLKRALKLLWDDPDIDQIRADELAGSYPTIRYGPPGEDFVIDLISRLGVAFQFEDLRAEIVTIEGVVVRVASPSTLYRMKSGTIRPIDHADAYALKEKFKIEDE